MNGQLGNPYVGPRTFEEADADRFFGREREAQGLLSLVMSQRLVLFYAPSGAGKSSLINTRLVPALRKEGFNVISIGRVGGQLPEGIDVIDNIYVFNLLLSLDQNRTNIQRLAHFNLSDYLQKDHTPSPTDLDQASTEMPAHILIIDQFEEIVSTHLDRWTEREGFFRQLRQAMVNDPLLWVVLIVREDYIAALDPYARFLPGRLGTRFHMQRLSYQAALEAIEKPAAQAGRPFAPRVAQALVDDLRQMGVHGHTETYLGEFVEPVQLQVVCYQLWENLKDQPHPEISMQDMADVGDVDAALGYFYDHAIARTVNETGESELEIRNWFEHQLITESGTRGSAYREVEKTGSIANAAVDLLERQFILRAEIRAGAIWYELVHDRFVAPILQANQAWQLRQSPLFQAALIWECAGRSRDKLYKGKQLKNTLATVSPVALDSLVQEFLTVSEEAQKQRNQRIKMYVTVVIALLAVSVALDYWLEFNVEQDVVSIQDDSASSPANSAAFSPDGQRIVTVNADGMVQLWDEVREPEPLVLKGHKSFVLSAAFSPDGQKIVTASADGTARLWSVVDGTEIDSLEVNIGAVNSAAFSPDGQRIVTAGNDGIVRLWDVTGRSEICSHEEHKSFVLSAAFSPDGQRIVTAGADGKVLLWDLVSESEGHTCEGERVEPLQVVSGRD